MGIYTNATLTQSQLAGSLYVPHVTFNTLEASHLPCNLSAYSPRVNMAIERSTELKEFNLLF